MFDITIFLAQYLWILIPLPPILGAIIWGFRNPTKEKKERSKLIGDVIVGFLIGIVISIFIAGVFIILGLLFIPRGF